MELYPINRNLYWLRTQRGMKQEEAAKAVGTKRVTYRMWENGRVPPEDMLRELSKLFKVSIPDLVEKELMPVEFHGLFNQKRLKDDGATVDIQTTKDRVKSNVALMEEVLTAKAYAQAGFELMKRVYESCAKLDREEVDIQANSLIQKFLLKAAQDRAE